DEDGICRSHDAVTRRKNKDGDDDCADERDVHPELEIRATEAAYERMACAADDADGRGDREDLCSDDGPFPPFAEKERRDAIGGDREEGCGGNHDRRENAQGDEIALSADLAILLAPREDGEEHFERELVRDGDELRAEALAKLEQAEPRHAQDGGEQDLIDLFTRHQKHVLKEDPSTKREHLPE